MLISREDVVTINKQFDKGIVVNEGSLVYAIERANESSDINQACAFLVRALAVDHVFEDGNKRTSVAVVMTIAEEDGRTARVAELCRGVVRIAARSSSVQEIEEVLRNVLQ